MLNKIKKLFMKKDEKDLQLDDLQMKANSEAIKEDFETLEDESEVKVLEAQLKARKEALEAANNIDVVPEPEMEGYDESLDENFDGREEIEPTEPDQYQGPDQTPPLDAVTDITDEEMSEFEPTEDEKDEMNNQADTDPEYLEYSSEAVGYENREQQWDTYRVITNYIGEGDSVLDFGCARGDFERFYETEFNEDLEYIGVDMNQQLIEAGKKVYDEEVELICSDWFSLDEDIKQDWSINIGSNNLRYDADTVRNDMTYLQDTIKAMMEHCEKGSGRKS